MDQKTGEEEGKDLLLSCCTFQLRKLEVTPYLYSLEFLSNQRLVLHFIGSTLVPKIITIQESFIWDVLLSMETNGLQTNG